jgi:hypothetical protein
MRRKSVSRGPLRRPRADSESDDVWLGVLGEAKLPDITVMDGATPYQVGFLQFRDREEADPEPAPDAFSRWRAYRFGR